jgi:hypothetical protein
MGHALPYTVAIRYRRERAIMEYSMRWVREHVEVYDHTGRFLFSAVSETRRAGNWRRTSTPQRDRKKEGGPQRRPPFFIRPTGP